MSFRISGTGSRLAEKVVTNDDLAKIMDTSDEWISTRTGICSRHISTYETAGYLAVEAAKSALSDSGLKAEDIDCVICATMRGDTFTPATACKVSEELGIRAPAYDVNAACSGMIYAFDIADGYIRSGKYENILVVTVEQMSKLVDWEDRASCVLFGDGAGAVVLQKGDGLKGIHISCAPSTTMIYGDSFCGTSIYNTTQEAKPVLHMQGQEVYKFAVSAMMAEVDAVLERAGLTTADIDYFLPHQANMRIIDGAAKRLGLKPERVLTNIQTCGNMSATSISVLLDEYAKKNTFKRGDKLLLVAFGAGMTSGACIVEWQA
jgi:3-oxoacyl-[acyl-carrier-protein] synthase-3